VRRRWRALLATAAVVSLAVAGGVFEHSARRLVRAPGAERPPVRSATPEGARALRVPVGPPAEELDVWVFDPDGAPRASVVAIHGLWDDKRSRVGFARELARDGARVVLVDLRGHGASTGDQIYYGGVESRDLAQVLDALDARGLLVEPVGVHGSSYGGAVAHQLAGRDPRVEAVVTVASFADLQGLMRAYAEMSWPNVAWAIPDAGLRLFAGRAAAHGGIDLAETDVVPQVRASDADVLLFHGDADEVVPIEQARRIQRACAPRGCRLVRLRGADHDAAMHDRGARAEGMGFLRERLGLAE
jgi:pimeloyl-ACP methyl ester carboxylesterase